MGLMQTEKAKLEQGVLAQNVPRQTNVGSDRSGEHVEMS